jgi:hypothetical protein
MLFEAFMLCSLLEDHTYLVIELPLKLDFLIIREGSQSRSPLWKGNCNQTHSSKQFFSGLTSTSSSILQKVVTLFPKAAFIYVIFSSISRILIWRPIYRQPVYVGIYIYTSSTCALKLSIGNKKKSVMNKSLQGRFREVIHNNYTLYYLVYMYTQICDENALI